MARSNLEAVFVVVRANTGHLDDVYVPDDSGETRGIAVMMIRRWRGHENFGYKDVDECMGIGCASAPMSVLKAASPLRPLTDTSPDRLRWAHEWRAACEARAVVEKRRRTMKAGMKVKLAHALSFGGVMLDSFETTTYTRRGKQRIAFRAPNGMLCNISTRHLATATIS